MDGELSRDGPAVEERPGTRTGDGPKLWVVEPEGNDCEHPGDCLRRVGSDGINAYYRCSTCEAVFVSRAELLRATRRSGGPAD